MDLKLRLPLFLCAAGLPLLLSSCVTRTAPIGEYQRILQSNNMTAYYPPKGDPKNVNDWNKLGPGTVLRKKQQNHYYRAEHLIGADGVKKAMDPQNASPIRPFSGKRFSGYEFDGSGGWSLDAANQIHAAANIKGATEVEIQFGKTYMANPFAESELHEALGKGALPQEVRRGLRRGRFQVVQDAVYTDSLKFFFKKGVEGGASASYKLTDQEIANLKAKGYNVVDGGVEIDQPTFIAYRPLPTD